nr:unnamed protein product [Brassica oleracea]
MVLVIPKSLWLKSSLIFSGKHLRIMYPRDQTPQLALLFHRHAFRIWPDP